MAPGLTLNSYEEVTSSLPTKALPNTISTAQFDSDENALVLKVFRSYIADLCEQFKGGHPG